MGGPVLAAERALAISVCAGPRILSISHLAQLVVGLTDHLGFDCAGTKAPPAVHALAGVGPRFASPAYFLPIGAGTGLGSVGRGHAGESGGRRAGRPEAGCCQRGAQHGGASGPGHCRRAERGGSGAVGLSAAVQRAGSDGAVTATSPNCTHESSAGPASRPLTGRRSLGGPSYTPSSS